MLEGEGEVVEGRSGLAPGWRARGEGGGGGVEGAPEVRGELEELRWCLRADSFELGQGYARDVTTANEVQVRAGDGVLIETVEGEHLLTQCEYGAGIEVAPFAQEQAGLHVVV